MPDPEMRSVFSSHIDEIGYTPDVEEFHVVFSNGRRVVYDGVPSDVAARVLSSASIGEALHSEIKSQGYKHRYV